MPEDSADHTLTTTISPLLFAFSLVFSTHAAAEPNPETVYKLKGSIVKIHTVTRDGGQGVGSGVVVAENHVATNCHVLGSASGINIAASGETHSPVAIKEDWRHDICILRFKYLPFKPVSLGDSAHLEYEQGIFSIGFPGGPPKPQTTFGNIKAVYPLDDGHILRVSTSFVLGASGSPVFNEQGELIGLSTFKSPGRNSYFYAVGVNWLKALLASDQEQLKVSDGTRPFWDAPPADRPFLMQVVIPMQNKDWKSVQQIGAAWVQVEPLNAEAHYYRALALQQQGELSLAKPAYVTALRYNAKHASSIAALASLARQEGDTGGYASLMTRLESLDADLAESVRSQPQ